MSVLWNLPKPSCKSMQCTPHRTIMNHIEINIEDHQAINFRKLPESSNFVATSKMLEVSTEDGRFSNTWRGACSKSFLSNLYFTLRVWRILVGGLGSCWDIWYWMGLWMYQRMGPSFDGQFDGWWWAQPDLSSVQALKRLGRWQQFDHFAYFA